jgi:hypothetical protein
MQTILMPVGPDIANEMFDLGPPPWLALAGPTG